MKGATSKLLRSLVGLEVIALLVLGFLAYYVRSFDKALGAYSDGLGRRLEPTPYTVQLVFGADRLWAGWGYFALDSLASGLLSA